MYCQSTRTLYTMSVPGRERSGNSFAWIPTTKILMIQCRIESKPTARGA
ncbi:hypothetical protein 20Sep418_00046 [Pseudomonas phage 20Sep418]|nr:hypothetical protein CBSLWZGG_CDS11 [Pseudomonas phage PseuPha1]WFG37207.1 hypothetical protein 9081_00106 [Pseudomonas phage bmx-p3]WFG37721.1 hypothetical protein 20Sep418_00046 [Pseudomonas phage 20Sep418]